MEMCLPNLQKRGAKPVIPDMIVKTCKTCGKTFSFPCAELWGWKIMIAGDQRLNDYFCSYSCFRKEEMKMLAKNKRKMDKLMWEAANKYDADGNLLATSRKKYTRRKSA